MFAPGQSAIAVATALACASPSWSNPTGGQVVGGSATISTPSASSMVIDQTSNKAIINWNTFSIGAGESVRFNQPSASSIALNRVLGNTRSEIFGSLTANGQIFLVNPNGVLIARGAEVSAAGFLASSLGITDGDFLSGRYNFTRGAIAGAVINEGNILTPGGYTALLAPNIVNNGLIAARLGSVALAAGDRVTLDFHGDGLLRVAVDEATLGAAIKNSGTITADGGRVVLTAKSANALLDTVLNNDGVIRADTLVDRGGVIALESSAGITSNSGSLLARGLNAGETGGTVSVTSPNVLLTSTAVADASGKAGGGNVFIGGNYQGQGPLANAQNTIVATGALLKADATDNGNGGQVVVWADGNTAFGGHVSAQGGPNGGDGGKLEVSGRQHLDFQGTADTRAPQGQWGNLLLDPSDITISNGAASAIVEVATASGFRNFEGTAPASTFNVTTLQNVLNTSPVAIRADQGSGGGTGSITVADPITVANTLSLSAAKDVTINADVTLTGAGPASFGAFRFEIVATNGNISAPGGVITAPVVNLTGQNITLDAKTHNISSFGIFGTAATGALTLKNAVPLTVAAPVSAPGGITITNSAPISINSTLSAGAGNISLTTTGTGNGISQNGTGVITANNLSLTTSNANVALNSVSNAVKNLANSSLGSGSLNFKSDQALTVTGAVDATGGITLTSSDAITINQSLNGGGAAVSLSTTGAGKSISQGANGIITAGTLTLQTSGGAVNLDTAASNVTNLGASNLGAATLRFKNFSGLNVTGAGTSVGTRIEAGGPLSIQNVIDAGSGKIELVTTGVGPITQTGAGALVAAGGKLTVTTANSDVTLIPQGAAVNNVTELVSTSTGNGNFSYTGNGAEATLFVTGGNVGSLTVANNNTISMTGEINSNNDIVVRSVSKNVGSNGLLMTSAAGSALLRANTGINIEGTVNAPDATKGNVTLISDASNVTAGKGFNIGNTFTVQAGPGQTQGLVNIVTNTNDNKITTKNVVLVADTLGFADFNGFTGTGTLSIAPRTAGNPMDIGTVGAATAGALTLDQNALTTMTSFGTINFGQTGALALPASTNTAGVINVGSSTITNANLNLFSNGADNSKNTITQSGALLLGGGTGTLGVVTAGGNVSLQDFGNTVGTLGAVSNGKGVFNFFDSAGGLIVSGPVNVTGLSITTAGSGDIEIKGAITDAGNSVLHNNVGSIIQTAPAPISNNDLTITAAKAISLTDPNNNLKGEVKFTNTGANNVAITNSGGLLLGTSSAGTGTLTLTALGGAITQSLNSTGLKQDAGAGAATFNAGTGVNANNITLDKTGNNFAGQVNLTGKNVVFHSDPGTKLTITLATTGSASIKADPNIEGAVGGDLTVDALTTATNFGPNLATTVGGNLSLTNTDTVTQTNGKSVQVTGTTLIDGTATNATITLNEGANRFTGAATFKGSAIQVTDSGALNATLQATDASKLKAGGNLSVTGVTKSLTTTTTGAGDTTTAALAVTNGNLVVTSAGKTIIGAGPTNVNGDFSIVTAGNVSQTGAGSQVIVGGGKLSISGGGASVDATLDKTNNTIGTLGDISLKQGALALNNLGALSIAGTTNQAGGGFTIVNDGQITHQAGAGTVDTTKATSGAAADGNISLTTINGSNDILVNNNINAAAGKVTLAATGNITQAGAGSNVIASALSATATAANTTVTLNGVNNQFSSITGSSPGDFSAKDGVAMTVGAAGVTSTGGNVTLLTTNGNLTLTGPVGASTKTGIIDLKSSTGSIISTAAAGTLSANAALLQAATDVDMYCGNVTCGASGNTINVIAGAAANGFFALQNNSALDVGQVNGVAGIASKGVSLLSLKTGDLSQSKIISSAGGLAIGVDAGSALLTLANNITGGNVGGAALGNGKIITFHNQGGFNVGQVKQNVFGGTLSYDGLLTQQAAGGVITLIADTGAITQSAGASNVISTNALRVTTANQNATLDNTANSILNLGPVDVGTKSFVLANSSAMAITGGTVSGDTIDLRQTGAGRGITQTAGGIVNTINNLLVSTINGNVDLTTAANGVTNLGTVSTGTGNFSLTDTVNGLTVTAPVSGNNITLSTSDFLAVNSTINGTGTVSLKTTQGVASQGDITQTAVITAAGLNATTVAGAITLTQNNNIAAAGTTSLNTTGAGNVALTNANGLTFGNSALGTGSLTIIAAGKIDQAANTQITQSAGAGAVSFKTTDHKITLNGPNNDFTGAVTLSNTAANNASINDVNSITLAPTTVGGGLTVTSGTGVTLTGNVTSGGAQTYTGGTTLATDVVLDAGAANAITLGVVTGAGKNLTTTGLANITSTASNLGALIANQTLTTGGAIGAGSVAVAGASTLGGIVTTTGVAGQTYTGPATGNNIALSAGTGPITATNAANDFSGTLTLTGGTVQVTDANALTAVLNSSGASTLNAGGNLALSGAAAGLTTTTTGTGTTSFGTTTVTGALASTSAGAVSQSGALSVTGTSNINAGANAITLTNGGNDFSGTLTLTGGTVQVTDANTLTAVLNSSGASTLNAGGNLALSGAAAGLTTTTTGTGTTSFGTTTVTGALASTSAGAVSQAGALAVTGTSNINAGADAITLTNGGNDFSGTLTLTGGTVQVTDANALTLGTLATGNLTVTSTGALNLGQGTISGALSPTSNGGAISQTGALAVTGTSTINAGAGTITLTSAGNDFKGAVALTNSGANAIAITDVNALILGASSVGTSTFTVNAGGPITQSGAITQAAGAGAATFNAGANGITLTNAGNDFTGLVSLNNSGANAVAITDTNAVNFGASGVGTSTFTVNAGGPITQSGAITQAAGAGAAIFNAGANAITLTNAGNDFTGPVSLNNSGANAVAITDTNAVNLGASGVGTSTFTVNAGGPITQSGAITQAAGAGAATFNAGANAITLTNAGNNFTGAVSLNNSGANAVAITDVNALILGASSVGKSTFTVNSGGPIAQSGSITQAAGAGAATFNAGANSITLTNAGNDFTGPVSLNNSGANAIAITDVTALILGASSVGTSTFTVNAGGPITQSGAITQAAGAGAGAATFNAGANAITLTNAGNDFTGPVSLNNSGANNVAINDTNTLALGASTLGSGSLAVTAAGAITQTGAVTQAANGGAVILGAGANPITLDAANDFNGTVTATGGNVTLNDINALTAIVNSIGTNVINGGGPLNISGTLTNLSSTATSAGGSITATSSAPTFTITGLGANNGAVNLTSDNLVIAGNGALGTGVLTTNGARQALASGAITAGGYTLATGAMTLVGGSMTLTGPLTVAPATLLTGGATVVNGPTANISGTFNLGGTVSTALANTNVLAGGLLTGVGTLNGNVNNSGTVAPGNSPGIINVIGNYVQSAAGTLNIELGGTTVGTGYDRIAVTGNAVLNGTLNVQQFGGFTPVQPDRFQIITTTGTDTGTFAAVTRPAPLSFAGLAVNYQSAFTELFTPAIFTPVPLDIIAAAAAAAAAPAPALPLFMTSDRGPMCLVGDVELLFYPKGAPIVVPQ